jgi:hypothetical protein
MNPLADPQLQRMCKGVVTVCEGDLRYIATAALYRL